MLWGVLIYQSNLTLVYPDFSALFNSICCNLILWATQISVSDFTSLLKVADNIQNNSSVDHKDGKNIAFTGHSVYDILIKLI